MINIMIYSNSELGQELLRRMEKIMEKLRQLKN